MNKPTDSSPTLAKRIAEIAPRLEVTARIDSYGGAGVGMDASYLKERHARLKKEIAAAEEMIDTWDAEAVAAQALAGLKADLAHKRASLMECEADLDAHSVKYGSESSEDEESDDSDDSEDEDAEGSSDSADSEKVLKSGNPYSIIRRAGKFVIENNETGKIRGSHSTYKKAMKQFRLLEGIEHGWQPTKDDKDDKSQSKD